MGWRTLRALRVYLWVITRKGKNYAIKNEYYGQVLFHKHLSKTCFLILWAGGPWGPSGSTHGSQLEMEKNLLIKVCIVHYFNFINICLWGIFKFCGLRDPDGPQGPPDGQTWKPIQVYYWNFLVSTLFVFTNFLLPVSLLYVINMGFLDQPEARGSNLRVWHKFIAKWTNLL